ncbi:hypothetical protein BT63DRAFT_428917 [Microthyrium microscopicum]|uniref:IDI-2 n=1 Tax=Microthyrium microscopicum TaxID=703497 RepID=A0A6A6TY10_9PEZI|nr:hypothetical protein BT63DRAFT_428917 [Microthyrium microscopicum]
MKGSSYFIAALGLAFNVKATALPNDASACGTLGVMPVPEGLNAFDVRACAEHPLDNVVNLGARDLSAQETCWFGKQVGCTGGYCWKVCDSGGKWCWTAKNGGHGDWWTCAKDNDCQEGGDYACGIGCSKCGCSC